MKEVTLPNLFCKASINLIPKPSKDLTRKKKHILISLITTDRKILNQILANHAIYKNDKTSVPSGAYSENVKLV